MDNDGGETQRRRSGNSYRSGGGADSFAPRLRGIKIFRFRHCLLCEH